MVKSLRKKLVLGVMLALGSTSAVYAAVTNDDLALVEEEINAIKEARETAVKASGYVDAEYVADSRDNKLNGFRMHHFSVFLSKQFNENWRFFSETEYEDGPLVEGAATIKGKIFVEAVNIDYQWQPSQYARIGRFFTPAGIWSVDHYPPFVPTQERPLHIRKMFPQIVDGVDAHGTMPMGSTFMNYDVYVANGNGTPGSGDDNENKSIGIRASFIIPAYKYLELGLSGYRDTNASNNKQTALGVHGKLKVSDFTLQAEYAEDDTKPLSGATTEKAGYYLQALYDISKWTLGYRYDFYDKDKSTNQDETRNSIFANYHVDSNIVWKLEHHAHTYAEETSSEKDYSLSMLSIAYYLE